MKSATDNYSERSERIKTVRKTATDNFTARVGYNVEIDGPSSDIRPILRGNGMHYLSAIFVGNVGTYDL